MTIDEIKEGEQVQVSYANPPREHEQRQWQTVTGKVTHVSIGVDETLVWVDATRIDDNPRGVENCPILTFCFLYCNEGKFFRLSGDHITQYVFSRA